MVSYFDGLLRYFEFAGRSSRKQYWLFYLFVLLAMLLASICDTLFLGWKPQSYGYGTAGGLAAGALFSHFGPLTSFVMIFHLIPNLTVTARRLHDIDRSGWWMLLSFVPFGGFVVLWWMCQPGTPYDNDYGSSDGDSSGGRFHKSSSRESAGYTLPPGRVVRMGATGPRPAMSFDAQGAPTQRFI